MPAHADGVCTYPTGSTARIFAALTCGHEHVTAEAARLLTRLWAPRAGRRGAPTWILTKGSRSQEEDGGQLSSMEDPITAKQAKSICLGPAGRCPFAFSLEPASNCSMGHHGNILFALLACAHNLGT